MEWKTARMDDHLHVDNVTTTTSYVIDGTTYSSLDEMPPDVRAKVERAIVDHNKNGIPDVMEDFVFPNVGAAAIDGAKDAASGTDGGVRPPAGEDDAGYATAGRALADSTAGSPAMPHAPVAPTITSGGLTGLAAGAAATSSKGRTIKLAIAAVAVAAIVVGIVLLIT
jgi:hypothetical protein